MQDGCKNWYGYNRYMKRRRKLQKNSKHRNPSILPPFLFVGSLVSLCVFGFFFFFSAHSRPELRPLALLHVPEEAKIVLPGPWIGEVTHTNVLGTETLDPRDIVTYVNEERMKRGIRPLRVNPILVKAAEMRARVIMKHQNFSHHDPYEGIQLDTVLPLLKYPFSWASENIGMGDTTGRTFVNGFMNSPSHKANLLNPELVETGVAVQSGPYKQYYVTIAVQLFAIPTDRSTFLGYTQKDVEEYKKLLGEIGKQRELTEQLKMKEPQNAEFYDRWERLLIRQQEIIATLSHTQAEEKPFAREMIAMIKEYNANWASVPLRN